MAIPAKNILGNPNVTEGSFQIAIEQLRESVIGSGKVYDSANTYMIKDTCEYSGVTYYSKVDNNIGNTPSVGANWGDYADLILGVVHKTGDETIAGMKTFSDNVGIGVTPSAWTVGYRALQIGGIAGAALMSSSNDTHLITNAYYNSGYKYQTSGVAVSDYTQAGGAHRWFTAPSGTAGNAINWTQSMMIDTSGNVLVTGSGGLGYGTGSGGTVTQLTSKGTNVTLNKPTGQIIMNNASLAAGESVYFDLYNSLVGANDTIVINMDRATGDLGKYQIEYNSYSGQVNIKLTNKGGVTYSDALTLKFAIIKGSIS